MAYVPDPTDPTNPLDTVVAGSMGAEFRALKGYLQGILKANVPFYSLGSYRNKLHNAGFNINQRNVNGSGGGLTVTTDAYTLDRWAASSTTSGSINIRQGATGGTPTLPFTNFIWIGTAAGSGNFSIYQRIESFDCVDLSTSGYITVSGYINVNGTALPFITLTASNTADNWTLGTTLLTSSIQVSVPPGSTGTWQPFSVTLPITGPTTLINHGIQLTFSWPTGMLTGEFFYLSNIQLEKGQIPTQFEVRPVTVDLAICQRYYEIGTIAGTLYAVSAGQGLTSTIHFSVPKRNVPTAIVLGSGTNTNLSSLVGFIYSKPDFVMQAVSAAGGLVIYNYPWSVSTDL